jgi:hypothetical protein
MKILFQHLTRYSSLLMHHWGMRVEPLPAWYRWVWEEKLVEMDGTILSYQYRPMDEEEPVEWLPAYQPYRNTLQAIEHQIQQFWRMGMQQVCLAEVEAVERQLEQLLMSVQGGNQ